MPKSMKEIHSGYSSDPLAWVSFLECWRDQVERRTGERVAGFATPTPPGSDQFRANDASLHKKEAELKKGLPPSYRHFALVTGGRWYVHGDADPAVSSHFSLIELVGAFKDRDPLNWGVWKKAQGGMKPRELPPDQYYRYGTYAQDFFRFEYIDHLVKVGELSQGAVLLLNPLEVTSDGEWESWLLSGQVGAKRYRSFAELMQVLAYQDVLNAGGFFHSSEKLRATCAGRLSTIATAQ